MSWSLSNIDTVIPKEVWENDVITHWMTSGMMIGIVVIAGSYSPVHFLLSANSKAYVRLTQDQQTVVVTHFLEALVLSILFVPFSYLALSLNFEEQQSLESFQHKATTVGTLMFVIIIMYMVELAARFQSPRPLVVLHHLCAFADALLAGIAPSTVNMKAASLLVYFICFEAITFWGLVMYRLWPQHRATRPIILVGMLTFGLSRPLQVTWIFTSLIVVWNDIEQQQQRWQALLQMALTMLFTVLQLYSLTIHYGMYKRCGGGDGGVLPKQSTIGISDEKDQPDKEDPTVENMDVSSDRSSSSSHGTDEITLLERQETITFEIEV